MSGTFEIRSAERQLAEEIRRRIGAGEWRDRLPGVVKLAALFGVNRRHVRRALGLLVESGDVVAPGDRRAMRPASGMRAMARHGTLIVHNQVEGISTGATMALFRALAEVMPAPVSIVRVEARRRSPDAIHAEVAKSDAEYMVLSDHTAALADRLAGDGIKTVMLGGLGKPRLAWMMAISYSTLVRLAFRRAFAAGHRRVSMPLWARNENTVKTLRAAIAEEYAASGLPHAPEFDCPVVEDLTPAGTERCVRELLRVTPPTVLVINDVAQWFTVTAVLAKLRFRVPEEMSTILLTQFDELKSYVPTQAHFRHPVEKFVAEIMRPVRRKRWPEVGKIIHVEPVWVPGDSLAPPAPVNRAGRR